MDHLIGQRFNLISKSDIRYVGTLHEINPQESTIALENVVSHGTEGRRNGDGEIAPSTSIYEYIVFRGSDVKDISVAEDAKENQPPEPPQVPDDPAILGSGSRPHPSRAPKQDNQHQHQQHAQQQSQPPPGYPHQPHFPYYYPPPPPGQDFGPPGRFPPPGPGFQGPPHFNGPPGGPPGWYPPPGQSFGPAPGQFPPNQSQGPIGPPGPQPPQQQAPQPPNKTTSELPVNDKGPDRPISKSATPAPSGPTPPVESKPSVAEALAPIAPTGDSFGPGPGPGPVDASTTQTAAKPPSSGSRSNRVAVPMTVGTKPSSFVTSNPTSNGPLQVSGGNAPPAAASAPAPASQPPKASVQDATRAATAAVAAAMAKLPPQTVQKKAQQADTSVENLTKKVNEMKTTESSRGARGGSRGDRGGRGNYRSGRDYQAAKKVEVPTTDFDFESSNAKFNKQDLVKEAIASGSPLNDNADAGTSIPANESANGHAVETNPTTVVPSYNKASSFFDNISSELRDREQNITIRPGGREWRGEEEKRNMETFGQGSVDGGYRGGYRGRGRGRGFNRGRGGFRGPSRGPRSGFRGGRGDSSLVAHGD